MKRIHAAAIALLIIATPALSGCWNGKDAATQIQATMNSGNGVEAGVGPIHVENATLVMGPDGSHTATLTTRIVNAGLTADQLVTVSINGTPADVTTGAMDLDPGASISFGYNSDKWINAYSLDAKVSTYVPVQLSFRDAGIVSISVLTVPPIGYYEGIAPNPPEAPATASASPTPSPAG